MEKIIIKNIIKKLNNKCYQKLDVLNHCFWLSCLESWEVLTIAGFRRLSLQKKNRCHPKKIDN